jgi:hypothetical protein
MAKTHPHLDQASLPMLRELVADRPDSIRDLYIAAHSLIIDTLPDVRWSVDTVDCGIGYAAHQYGYNGWGMAAVEPHTRWVNLQLLAGARLPDPTGIMEGSAAAMRHVKLHDLDQLAAIEDDVRALLEAAAALHSP